MKHKCFVLIAKLITVAVSTYAANDLKKSQAKDGGVTKKSGLLFSFLKRHTCTRVMRCYFNLNLNLMILNEYLMKAHDIMIWCGPFCYSNNGWFQFENIFLYFSLLLIFQFILMCMMFSALTISLLTNNYFESNYNWIYFILSICQTHLNIFLLVYTHVFSPSCFL